ncbi:MAG TPA: sulfurtransferase-like selenium metabolism protein YedF [Thermodesulfobacteriota bacterium]|nr:sulfurtransferase-like selenium metabolism protein YedF [Thermodesulfobacteriota bacterium]
MKRIDCRGLACPQPVLETRKALQSMEGAEIQVVVDNAAARENVRRFAESQGHNVSISEGAGIFELTIQKGEASPARKGREEKGEERSAVSSGLVLFVDSDSLGRGSEELGKILIRVFLQTAGQSEPRPGKIIFMNSGVKLACEGSEVIEELQEFESKGTEVLSCGTCLDFYGLKNSLRAGRVSNMYEIYLTLSQAGKVIKV